ncbi:MAG TPA: hypothetical protein VII37_02235, partial [Candidatus Acidoferrum sp.]
MNTAIIPTPNGASAGTELRHGNSSRNCADRFPRSSNVILAAPIKFMPYSLTHWSEFTLRNGLHLLGIVAAALLLNRLLRVVTNLVIKRASSPTRAAQMREQQTRTLAGLLFSAGTKVVWGIALLTALPEFGIN